MRRFKSDESEIKFSSVTTTVNICMVYRCVLVSAISLPFILCLWQKEICFNLSFHISHGLLCLLFLSNFSTDFMLTKHPYPCQERRYLPFIERLLEALEAGCTALVRLPDGSERTQDAGTQIYTVV